MANPKPFAEAPAVQTASVPETLALGEMLALDLTAGRVLSLEGPLGAGKTHFVKGLARGLGSSGMVSSPTFTLVHEYSGGRLPLVHFDFYRLERIEDVAALGFDDYLDGSAIVAIEWGDRYPSLLPRGTWRLRFELQGDSRCITREIIS